MLDKDSVEPEVLVLINSNKPLTTKNENHNHDQFIIRGGTEFNIKSYIADVKYVQPV